MWLNYHICPTCSQCDKTNQHLLGIKITVEDRGVWCRDIEVMICKECLEEGVGLLVASEELLATSKDEEKNSDKQ